MTTRLDRLFEIRDRQRAERATARVVARGREIPWEDNQQGHQKWYMHPDMAENALNTLLFCVQELPPGGRSGKQRIPGGGVGYAWRGRGYTLIDGESQSWEEGDVLNFPVRVDGLEIQHFNNDLHLPATLVLVEPNLTEVLGVDRGPGFEQLEPASRPKTD